MKLTKLPPAVIGWGIAALVVAGALWQNQLWLPSARQWLAGQLSEELQKTSGGEEKESGGDAHAGHDHGHAGHDEGTSLELSAQARNNIGLTNDMIREIELQQFTRTINVPAIVVERPGRTRLKIVAPMTGVVTAVNLIKGESNRAGCSFVFV